MSMPKNASDIDSAADLLRRLAVETKSDVIELLVRPDGRVELSGRDGTGSHQWRRFADLVDGGSLGKPSAGYEDAWRMFGKSG